VKSVFLYSDYRLFLSDFYNTKKINSSYSYRHFSVKAKLNSPNYLALVIAGTRDLTVLNIHQFAIALDLRADELEYFETIVLLGQSTSENEFSYYENRRKKLLKNKPKQISKHKITSIMAEWSHAGILVLAHGHTLEKAIEKIQSEIGIKSLEIKKVLSQMVEAGLLSESTDKKLKISSAQITFNDKGVNYAQEKSLLQQLEQSFRAFKKTYSNKSGKFISHSLTVPEGAIEKIQDKFIAFMENLTEEMDSQLSPEDSKLAQINIQIFHPKKWD
jgi:uncharacterized protein (TIGR02147 family)